jgi:hypothetical protein
MISDAILSLIIGSTAGILALLIKVIHNSKCTKVSCFGSECIRNTGEEQTIQIDTPPTGRNNISNI